MRALSRTLSAGPGVVRGARGGACVNKQHSLGVGVQVLRQLQLRGGGGRAQALELGPAGLQLQRVEDHFEVVSAQLALRYTHVAVREPGVHTRGSARAAGCTAAFVATAGIIAAKLLVD